jgi:hypothetical protein
MRGGRWRILWVTVKWRLVRDAEGDDPESERPSAAMAAEDRCFDQKDGRRSGDAENGDP